MTAIMQHPVSLQYVPTIEQTELQQFQKAEGNDLICYVWRCVRNADTVTLEKTMQSMNKNEFKNLVHKVIGTFNHNNEWRTQFFQAINVLNDGRNQFHRTLDAGNLRVAKFFWCIMEERCKELLQADAAGRTPLHIAAQVTVAQADTQLLKWIKKISDNADFARKDEKNKTPYDYVIKNPALVKVLDIGYLPAKAALTEAYKRVNDCAFKSLLDHYIDNDVYLKLALMNAELGPFIFSHYNPVVETFLDINSDFRANLLANAPYAIEYQEPKVPEWIEGINVTVTRYGQDQLQKG